MYRRHLIIGAVLIIVVATAIASAFSTWSKGLEAQPRMSVRVKTIPITSTGSLFKDAKPLPWRAEIINPGKKPLPARLSDLDLSKAALLKVSLGPKTLYIALQKDNGGLVASVFSQKGEKLESRLIVVKRMYKKIPIRIETANVSTLLSEAKRQLVKKGISVSDKTLDKVAEYYSEARAYRVVSAKAYVLEAKLPGKGYTPLAYFLWASTCFQWQIAGHTVYEVCAEGTFYVNPGTAVYVVQDTSHYSVSPPLSSCKFTHSASNTPVSATIRADGEAALMDCPVTTKYSASASETVDIWGGFHPWTHGNKWIAFGRGAKPIP